MKKLLLFLFALILAIALQFIVSGWAGKRVINFFLILVIMWGYHKGWKEGILVGFFSGLVQDILFFPIIGINAFALSLIGFLTSEAKSKIYQQNIISFALMVGIVFLINNLIISLWILLFHRLPFVSIFLGSLHPSIFYTCGLCSFVFLVMAKPTKSSIPKT